jgi:hypothetical protein
MGILPSFNKEPTIDELEEKTETLEAENRKMGQEVSLEEKKLLIAQLKERQTGLTPKNFNFDFQAIKQWLKTH